MKKVFICIAAVAASVSVMAQVKPKVVKKPVEKKAAPGKVQKVEINDSTTSVSSAKMEQESLKRKKQLQAAGVKTSMDSLAYAIGVNISGSLQQQQLGNINLGLLQKGLADGIKNKSIIDAQQCNNVIQVYMQALQQKQQVAAMQQLNEEKARANAFLDSNKKRPGVITLPSGLQYEVLTKGPANGPMPTLADTVVTDYDGRLIDGTPFDNSYSRGQPYITPVSRNIAGWTEALQLMHIGDKWKIFVPSSLAYGDRGIGQGAIPGGAALVFILELHEIKPGATH